MTTHKQAFSIRTPGQIIAGELSKLFTTGALKDWRPDAHLSALSRLKTRGDWNNLRKLQSEAVGNVADVGLLALGAGYGIGKLRHAHKVRTAKKQLDEIESSRTEKQSSNIISGVADLGTNIVRGIAATVWNIPKWMQEQAEKYDPRNADSANVPLGPLSKGWVVPAALLGAPAAVYAGDRLASRRADTERTRLIAERKARLEAEFNQLLSQTSAKRAFTDPATAKCASYLDFMVAQAEKQAKMDGSTAMLGGVFSFWILSGILAAKAGYDHGKKDDPGKVEQKALKTYEQRSRAGRPTTVRLVHPGNVVPDYQVSDAPYPMAFQPHKQANIAPKAVSTPQVLPEGIVQGPNGLEVVKGFLGVQHGGWGAAARGAAQGALVAPAAIGRGARMVSTAWKHRDKLTPENIALFERHGDKLTPENIALFERHGDKLTPENIALFERHGDKLTPENIALFERHGDKLTPENIALFEQYGDELTPENIALIKHYAPHIKQFKGMWDGAKDILRPAWQSIQRGFGNFMQKAKPVLGDIKGWAHRALAPPAPFAPPRKLRPPRPIRLPYHKAAIQL
jgi:hypothetical protein